MHILHSACATNITGRWRFGTLTPSRPISGLFVRTIADEMVRLEMQISLRGEGEPEHEDSQIGIYCRYSLQAVSRCPPGLVADNLGSSAAKASGNKYWHRGALAHSGNFADVARIVLGWGPDVSICRELEKSALIRERSPVRPFLASPPFPLKSMVCSSSAGRFLPLVTSLTGGGTAWMTYGFGVVFAGRAGMGVLGV